MGGLVIVIPVIILNLIFSPAGITKIAVLVFGIIALLGAFDDILNIYGKKRKVRSIRRTMKLIRVHKNLPYRIFLLATFPWQFYKRVFYILGSNPGKGLFAHEKIIVQIIAGLIAASWIFFRVEWTNPGDLWVPFLGVVNISFLMIPFIVFVVAAMTNAVNIADGMDGLSAGLLLPAFGAFLAIAYHQEASTATTFADMPNVVLCSIVIGGLIAYLYFNIPPARFQMGDVGSLALGSLLAVLAFSLRVPLLLLIIGFPFVAEVTSVIIQAIARRVFGKRLFRMAPIHHHFEMLGWSEEKVVMRFWIGGVICALIGLWIYFAGGWPF
jgi:phospho-N-acetylmuramoyl-pentapeptide-transferase